VGSGLLRLPCSGQSGRLREGMQVPIPADVAAAAAAKRAELVERVAEVDEELGELFLEEAPIDAATLRLTFSGLQSC